MRDAAIEGQVRGARPVSGECCTPTDGSGCCDPTEASGCCEGATYAGGHDGGGAVQPVQTVSGCCCDPTT